LKGISHCAVLRFHAFDGLSTEDYRYKMGTIFPVEYCLVLLAIDGPWRIAKEVLNER